MVIGLPYILGELAVRMTCESGRQEGGAILLTLVSARLHQVCPGHYFDAVRRDDQLDTERKLPSTHPYNVHVNVSTSLIRVASPRNWETTR